MSTAQGAPPTTEEYMQTAIDHNADLFRGFIQAIVANPALGETSPDGALTVFLPRDCPDQFDAALALAEYLARQGANVYLRHVHADGSPVPLPVAPSDEA